MDLVGSHSSGMHPLPHHLLQALVERRELRVASQLIMLKFDTIHTAGHLREPIIRVRRHTLLHQLQHPQHNFSRCSRITHIRSLRLVLLHPRLVPSLVVLYRQLPALQFRCQHPFLQTPVTTTLHRCMVTHYADTSRRLRGPENAI